ncbi:MAG: alpha/beta hydrolase [Solirubrobacterales bacterium]|nr:alpha/beta hydrolase [Solirubrobacterales bacterium]MBV9942935.1 alpha/beta hydrolase [Solirubrobacterales bacterium]
MAALADIDLRDGYADLSGARIHYVEAGDGPMVVLLHGFPEFWYSWRRQIPALARAGLRVIAPDMRGYNLSSKPRDVSLYEPRRLAHDLRELIAERGATRAFVAGHDWGGAVAWIAAMAHPEAVERLAILNVPHPRRMLEALSRPGKQLARSWYMFFFQLPWLPEETVRAGDWWFFRYGFERDARPGAFTPDDLARYRAAWSQPGAATATINYYRASLRRQAAHRADADAELRRVQAPTLVIWGERDRHLGAELAEPDRADVPNLQRVVRLPDASHWVQHDEPERVSALLIDFFKR